MKNKQLKDLLSQWPDEAEIEISVAYPGELLFLQRDGNSDRFWVEIVDIERPGNNPEAPPNEHCLIYAGKIVLG